MTMKANESRTCKKVYGCFMFLSILGSQLLLAQRQSITSTFIAGRLSPLRSIPLLSRFDSHRSTIAGRKQAQLLCHPEVVAVREMVGDLPITKLVPVNVLNLEPLARRLHAH